MNIKTDNIFFFLPAEIYELTQSFRSLIFDDRYRVTYPGTVKKVSFFCIEDTDVKGTRPSPSSRFFYRSGTVQYLP